MKCRTTRNIDVYAGCEPYVSTDVMGRKVIPAGTVICQAEYPPADCVALVRNGLADPVDDECRKAANRTQFELDAAKEAIERMYSGELPEDVDDDDDSEEDDDE